MSRYVALLRNQQAKKEPVIDFNANTPSQTAAPKSLHYFPSPLFSK
jgi:hypothetical protein